MSDLISRQDAIEAINAYLGLSAVSRTIQNMTSIQEILENLPSAQPEHPFEIQDILNYLDTVLHPIISPEHWNVYSELHDMISMLPSAESECTCCEYRVGDLCCYSDVKTDMEAMEEGEEEWHQS